MGFIQAAAVLLQVLGKPLGRAVAVDGQAREGVAASVMAVDAARRGGLMMRG